MKNKIAKSKKRKQKKRKKRKKRKKEKKEKRISKMNNVKTADYFSKIPNPIKGYVSSKSSLRQYNYKIVGFLDFVFS